MSAKTTKSSKTLFRDRRWKKARRNKGAGMRQTIGTAIGEVLTRTVWEAHRRHLAPGVNEAWSNWMTCGNPEGGLVFATEAGARAAAGAIRCPGFGWKTETRVIKSERVNTVVAFTPAEGAAK